MTRRFLFALGLLLAAPALAADIIQQAPTTFSGTDFQRNSGVIGINPGRGPIFRPADYGADITGATDATVAIQAAQAACAAAGGGEISIDGMRLLHNSDINPAAGCPIRGSYTPAVNATVDYSQVTSALIHPPLAVVRMGPGSEMSGVAVLSSTLPATVPADVKTGATLVRGMKTAGNGVWINGNSVRLTNTLVAGFNLGIYSPSWSQIKIDSVFVDAITGYFIRNSHDLSVLRYAHVWPFLTASQSWSSYSGAISGVADNGSGVPRITSPTDSLTTGDPVFISSVPGFTGVNTKCVVAIVDAANFDCSNLATSPTATASVTSGSLHVKLSAINASVSAGQAVTDSAGLIPGGTTVLWVDQAAGYMRLSQKATGTNAADTLTFTNGAYVGPTNGLVKIDHNYRDGDGFHLDTNVMLTCQTCFVINHSRGFNLINELNDQYIASASDFSSGLGDPTAVGLYISGSSRSNFWSGGYIHGAGTAIVVDSTNTADENVISGLSWIYQGPASSPTVELVNGAVILNAGYIVKTRTNNAPVYVSDTISKVSLSGNDFAGAQGNWTYLGSSKIRRSGTQFGATDMTAGVVPSAPIGGTTSTSVAGGGSVVFLHGQQPSASGGPTIRETISGSGRIRNLAVENTVAPDTSTHVITIQRNGADTGVFCTIATGARNCNTIGSGLEQSFTTGDTWNFKAVNNGTVAAVIKASVEWVPDQ